MKLSGFVKTCDKSDLENAFKKVDEVVEKVMEEHRKIQLELQKDYLYRYNNNLPLPTLDFQDIKEVMKK